jgi:hypothetical protein
MSASDTPRPWYESLSFSTQCTLAVLIIAALGVEAYVAIVLRQSDFVCHYHYGQAFLDLDPYRYDGDWYPLSRMMMNAGLALLPQTVSRTICYLLSIGCLCGSWWMWARMAEPLGQASAKLNRVAGLLAAALLGPYLVRDLDECGLQLFLLFFLSASAYALSRGRKLAAGAWLATAITYKATPMLFLPLFIWKRQWRALAATIVVLAAWTISPAIFLGYERWWAGQQQWWTRAQHIASAHEAYPSLQEMEAPKPQNVGLRALLARYLETYPPGHPLYIRHPGFVQFGNLPDETAHKTIQAILLVIAAYLAWQFRHRWSSTADDNRSTLSTASLSLPTEWAIVAGLCALLSPLCWKQHLVLFLPCAFLIIRDCLLHPSEARQRWAVLALLAAFALVGRRTFVGREMAILLMSYKLDTINMLALGWLTLWLPARVLNRRNAQPVDEQIATTETRGLGRLQQAA